MQHCVHGDQHTYIENPKRRYVHLADWMPPARRQHHNHAVITLHEHSIMNFTGGDNHIYLSTIKHLSYKLVHVHNRSLRNMDSVATTWSRTPVWPISAMFYLTRRKAKKRRRLSIRSPAVRLPLHQSSGRRTAAHFV